MSSSSSIESINGSSPTGGCSLYCNTSINIQCFQPNSSVLFDGNIPTLTAAGLNDDSRWARDLLTVVARRPDLEISVHMGFTFPNQLYNIITGVEVVMFNCPWWGIGVEKIEMHTIDDTTGKSTRVGHKFINPDTLSSCDSLVRLCIHGYVDTSQYQYTSLSFFHSWTTNSTWVHLAEMTFYEGYGCGPDEILDYTSSSLPVTMSPIPMTPTILLPSATYQLVPSSVLPSMASPVTTPRTRGIQCFQMSVYIAVW